MSIPQAGEMHHRILTFTLLLTLCWLSACQSTTGGSGVGQPTKIATPPGPSPSMPPTATSPNDPAITNFDDCLAAGFPIMESYPRQCRAADGTIYVEDIGNELEKIDLIRLDFTAAECTDPEPARDFWRGAWFLVF